MTAHHEAEPDAATVLPPVHESLLPTEHALHRPRHGATQRVSLICAVVFLTLPAVAFVLGAHPREFENRALTGFPGITEIEKLQPWASDHLPLREQAIGLYDAISRGVFGEPPARPKSDQAGAVIPTETSKAPKPKRPPVTFPDVVEGTNGWLYLGNELASHCSQSLATDETVRLLRTLRDGVTSTGRQFVVVVAPDKATLYPQNLPADLPGRECHREVVDEFWAAMSREDYVLDVRQDLADWGERLGTPVYGPVDAHWGEEGGVVTARRVAEKLRPGLTSTWRVDEGPAWRSDADLPPLIGRTGTTTGLSYRILPDGKTSRTRDDTPRDLDKPLRLNTTTGIGTYGPRVGMIGDSFTTRTTKYLGSAFCDLTIMHHAQLAPDRGEAAGRMLADTTAVVVEVAERSLVAGTPVLLSPVVIDTIVAQLKAKPVR
ncbi:hypothetical protein ABZ816_32960 [Actinosynnema sp. NPDC047251]|uniref:AlgX/AlgJ SGNH hydrolase-like domain-containing protein n=1 Tax=Saccharothrix espanaensis (strain ATCC 51144 / DSM 44229 / JCM 9112 / NBRC 15066 / NRRL 15764) TaxID=1179773 RepID=K0JPR2_SACES|nr:hypothetical protein [Saccharothrix espanaensis]CCH27401.1 hypothetical protein BN6_00690 [Saccharothrix espanaensis DSM 44229]